MGFIAPKLKNLGFPKVFVAPGLKAISFHVVFKDQALLLLSPRQYRRAGLQHGRARPPPRALGRRPDEGPGSEDSAAVERMSQPTPGP